MREQLQSLIKSEITGIGTVTEIDFWDGTRQSILLTNLLVNEKIYVDHVWADFKVFGIPVAVGMKVEFIGGVTRYIRKKGKHGERDYGIRITQMIREIPPEERIKITLF